MIGTIFPKDTLFLRMHVGNATGPDNTKYEMTTGMDGAPMVRNEKTGKWFGLSWTDILSLADQAGINVPEEELCKHSPELST